MDLLQNTLHIALQLTDDHLFISTFSFAEFLNVSISFKSLYLFISFLKLNLSRRFIFFMMTTFLFLLSLPLNAKFYFFRSAKLNIET
jgi:hypothetical protein